MKDLIREVTEGICSEYAKPSSVPKKYLSGLKGKEREERAKEIVSRSKEARRADESPSAEDDAKTRRPFRTGDDSETKPSKYTVAFRRKFGEGLSRSYDWPLSRILPCIESHCGTAISESIMERASSDDSKGATNLLRREGFLSPSDRVEFCLIEGSTDNEPIFRLFKSATLKECDCGCHVCGGGTEPDIEEDLAVLSASREAFTGKEKIAEVFDAHGLIIERFGDLVEDEALFEKIFQCSWKRFLIENASEMEEAIVSERELLRAALLGAIEEEYLGEGKGKKRDKEGSPTAKLREISQKTGAPYRILKKVFDKGVAAWRTGHRPGATPVQWGLARVYSFTTGGKTARTADKKLYDQWKSN